MTDIDGGLGVLFCCSLFERDAGRLRRTSSFGSTEQ